MLSISNFSPYSVYSTVKSKSSRNWNYDVSVSFAQNNVTKDNFNALCSCRDQYGIKGEDRKKICWHVVITLLRSIDQSPVVEQTNSSNPSTVPTDEWEVERILGVKNVNGNQQYLVKWHNYGNQDATWETQENLGNAKESLAYLQTLIHNARTNYVSRNQAN